MSTTAAVAPTQFDKARRLFTRNEKVVTAAYLFAVMLAWCAIRSTFTGEGADNVSEAVVPTWIRTGFLIGLFLPAIAVAALRLPLAWLLGLSAAVGQLPRVPFLPFLYDYTHAITLFFFLFALSSFMRKEWSFRPPAFAVLFAAYVALCLLSAILNYAGHGNIWQAKVGISFLILFIPVSFLIFYFASTPDGTNSELDQMLDGLVWGMVAQGLIAVVAIPALIFSPSIAGNDTLYGLGYFYRYKATFSGPVSFAFFVIVSVPLVLLWAQRTGKLHWAAATYLQFSPWLLMATASRAGRVAAIIPFLMLLRHETTRRQMLLILPSAVISYWLCFYYVSLPAALNAAIGVNIDPSFDISDRYFSSTERTELVKETVQSMLNAPWLVDLLGNGPGVGGYSTSGFPAAHNMLMNVWVETGVAGVLLFVGFVTTLFIAVLRRSFVADACGMSAWIATTCLAGFGLSNAAYQTGYWGYALIIIFVSVCVTRCSARRIES